MLAQSTVVMDFPLVESLRAQIRADKNTPAGKAEIEQVAGWLAEAFTSTVTEGYEPDAESRALDEMFRSERLSVSAVSRYYRTYINMKFRPAAE
ncbi:MAG TPA: hypothetical protein VND94_18820 [Terriglobia bacterium]|nr:hypothetical protein [Terriglobia bacterium]